MFKKTLLAIVALVLVGYIAFAAVDTTEITFDTVTSGTFDQSLRGWIDTLNDDIVLAFGVIAGDIWYVDGNKANNLGDGKSWDGAYNLLSTALAASHADIAITDDREWASRNTIYFRNTVTEDIVLLAQKTDIIGVGTTDAYSKSLLIGTITIPESTGAAADTFMGCRFINVMFYDDDAGGALIDIDTQTGIEFYYCLFNQNATDTYALYFEECSFVVIDNCEFSWTNQNGWSLAAIYFQQDTDVLTNCKITNNWIRSGGVGIHIAETNTLGCLIADNVIDSTGLTIDDDGGDGVICVRNILITAIDCDTYAEGTGFDFNVNRAANNYLMGSGSGKKINQVPPEEAD